MVSTLAYQSGVKWFKSKLYRQFFFDFDTLESLWTMVARIAVDKCFVNDHEKGNVPGGNRTHDR